MNDTSFSIRVTSGNHTIAAIDAFTIHQNRITFLFGESGIGKSILSKAVYGVLDPDEVAVTINGKPYSKHLDAQWTKEIQNSSYFVFQEPSSHLNPLMKIGKQISEGSLASCTHRETILTQLWQLSNTRADAAFLNLYPKPYRPSGGEKQRLLLAMAFEKIDLLLSSKPASTLFIFDEPTGSLDDSYRNLFLDLLFKKYREHAFTILIITHDYSIISHMHSVQRDLMSVTFFEELTRHKGSQVSIQPFSSTTYLEWLGTQKSASRSIPSSTTPVLEFDASFGIFGRKLALYKDKQCMQPASLIIKQGEMAYIKAASGVGKTTLAKIIMGIYKADYFTQQLAGRKFTNKTSQKIWRNFIWGKKAGMVFQHADEALNLQSRVCQIFSGLPTTHGIGKAAIQKILEELFDATTVIPAFLEKKCAYLSGGQKQRLNVLRTLTLQTDLVILDEPLNGLDFSSVKKVLELLEAKRRKGSALLMISHNEEIFDTLVGSNNTWYLGEAHS